MQMGKKAHLEISLQCIQIKGLNAKILAILFYSYKVQEKVLWAC